MTTTPTPDEARQALRDVEHRREQSATAAAWPRWTWIATGIAVAGYGLLADQASGFVRTWGTPITVLLLAASVAVNTRWGSALLRRPVRPRTTHDPANMLWTGLVLVLVIAASALAAALDVPHAALWGGLAGGLVLAVAGPWWERRVLAGGSRR